MSLATVQPERQTQPKNTSLKVLFGHPGGNPNSHNAALAHYEANQLEAFCVPWMPSKNTIDFLAKISPAKSMVDRLGRRHFPELKGARLIQGRIAEMRRLATRALGRGDEGLSYEANDWLMTTMARECRRASVTAVHAYEDCALLQFAEAKRLGKACIYDMPIGYYPAWETTQAELARKCVDWLPTGGLPSARFVRPQQKKQEMTLADLVLAPSSFAANTIRSFHPSKPVAVAPYGVDLDFWKAAGPKPAVEKLRFIYAGEISLRKGTPDLLRAWEMAGLSSTAELTLVGTWALSETKRKSLPKGVTYIPPVSRQSLRDYYRQSEVFVFPSYFEGFGLVLLEALACGLPTIASEATCASDILSESCGQILPVGNLEALVESLRWFDGHRDCLPAMRIDARKQAEQFTWLRYRTALRKATAAL